VSFLCISYLLITLLRAMCLVLEEVPLRPVLDAGARGAAANTW
jgi:hypothetical protein